ncbi:MAG: IstB-IS21 domain-containing protein [Lachnoclostridium sp.]|jgi:DNA replication protein DnaC
MQALRSGMTVYYASLAHLISDLKKADLQGKLERRWRVYTRPDILIIDEVGYMQLDRASAELFFRLICTRYENGSIILTSNKYFGDWGELMNDTVIATAILDRLLHHAHIINIRGDSYRLKSRIKGGVKVVPPADIPELDNMARGV